MSFKSLYFCCYSRVGLSLFLTFFCRPSSDTVVVVNRNASRGQHLTPQQQRKVGTAVKLAQRRRRVAQQQQPQQQQQMQRPQQKRKMRLPVQTQVFVAKKQNRNKKPGNAVHFIQQPAQVSRYSSQGWQGFGREGFRRMF